MAPRGRIATEAGPVEKAAQRGAASAIDLPPAAGRPLFPAAPVARPVEIRLSGSSAMPRKGRRVTAVTRGASGAMLTMVPSASCARARIARGNGDRSERMEDDMATKLQVRESDLSDEQMVSIRAIPFEKLGPFSATLRPLPKWAIVMEIDFKEHVNTDGVKELLFYFSRYNDVVNLEAYGGIERLINDVSRPGFTFTHDEPIYPDPVLPHSSPLSLRNEQRSYVIYRLSAKNWQFGRRGYPITVGTADDDKDYCFDAFKVPSSGYADRNPGFAFTSMTETPLDNCKVAFFISDGEHALHVGGENEYSHAINLHVDLVYKSPARRIPIMVDPDVRFPGGAHP
jgi:hypothetical protein